MRKAFQFHAVVLAVTCVMLAPARATPTPGPSASPVASPSISPAEPQETLEDRVLQLGRKGTFHFNLPVLWQAESPDSRPLVFKSGKMTITANHIGPVWQKSVADQIARLLSLRIRTRARRRSTPVLEEPVPTPEAWEKQHHYRDSFHRAKEELLSTGRVSHPGELEAVARGLGLSKPDQALESEIKLRAANQGLKLKAYRAGTVGLYPGALVKSGKDLILYALVQDEILEWRLSGTRDRMFLAPIVASGYLQPYAPPPAPPQTGTPPAPTQPMHVRRADVPVPAKPEFSETLPYLVWLILFTVVPAARRSMAGFQSARAAGVRPGPRSIKGAFVGAFKGFAWGAALSMVGLLFLIVPASQKNFLTLLLVSFPATLAALLGALLVGFFACTGALLASSRLGARATGLCTALCAAAGIGFFWMRLAHYAVH